MSRKPKNSILIETPELKRQLQEAAMVDFDKFLELLALDEVQVFVCINKAKGASFQKIADRLKLHGIEMKRQSVAERCRKCKGDS